MGLDMYLRASRYVGGWKHGSEADQKLFKDIAETAGVKDLICEGAPSLTVSINCAYWRKANAIHGWFVTNVQDGEDECRPHYVSRDHLKALKGICEKLIVERVRRSTSAVNKMVLKLLPPTGGFFFGSTDIDKYFWEDIESTVSQLERALSIPEDFDFEYQSSW